MKLEQEIEFSLDEIEYIFNRVVIPAKTKKQYKGYMIYVNLTPNKVSVINLCKNALVREFGAKEAARYIAHREGNDYRGLQFWLKYQIEKTAYADDWCLIRAAMKWFASHPATPS